MGTVRREPVEIAGRGVLCACVRSGISGWRDRAPDPWACGRQGGARRIKITAAARWRGRRRFFCLGFEVGAASAPDLGGRLRQQPLATAWPAESLRMGPHPVGFCNWILQSAARDRSLNLLSQRGRVSRLGSVSSRARGRPLGRRFRFRRRRRQLWGLFGASRSKPLAEGCSVRVCALAFQVGEIVLLIRGRAGAKAARGESR